MMPEPINKKYPEFTFMSYHVIVPENYFQRGKMTELLGEYGADYSFADVASRALFIKIETNCIAYPDIHEAYFGEFRVTSKSSHHDRITKLSRGRLLLSYVYVANPFFEALQSGLFPEIELKDFDLNRLMEFLKRNFRIPGIR